MLQSPDERSVAKPITTKIPSMGIEIPTLGIEMSMADFLFSTPVQNILRVVYASPDRTFMLNELLDHAGAGRGNGQRHIEHLLKAGVLVEEPRRGHQRAIRASTEFPLYPELLSICRKSFGLVEPIREALKPFESKITEAFVFGSVAKGTDTYRSDIDLMVVGTVSMIEVMEAVLKVEQGLGRHVHLNMFTADEWADLKVNDPVLARIAADYIVKIIPDA